MKKALSILLLLSLLLVLKSFAQEKHKMFAVDSLFMADLTEHFRGVGESSEKEARECLSSLSYQWTANLLLPSEKKQVQTVCLALQDLKLSVDPYFVSYLQAISMMVKRNYDEKSFLDFDHSVSFCLAGKAPSRTVISYLNQVNLLLHDNAFLKTGAEAWYCRNAEFAFQFDTVPAFYFKKVSLACVVRKDSSCIYNTSGRYYPVQQKWIGTGGKVYWDREGLSRDTVYATLADYSFNTRLTYYTADSVTLMHGGYFRKPLTGKLEEKVMSDITPDRAIYPKFAMYPGNRLIIRLFNNIEYEGGFSLEGAKIIGFSSKNSPAKIIVDRNNEPFMEFTSREFVIRPDRFVAARANAVIYIGGDSIYHPGVQVRYSLENNEISLVRTEEGLSQSPFFDTYHKLDLYPEALYWKLGESVLSLEAVRGIREKGEAVFESADYYSGFRFDKLQGIDDVNPVILVSAYSRKYNTSRFFAEDLATFLKKPIEQVRVQLIKMANMGFLSFDIDEDFVTLKPRLNEYLASRSGVKDYDIIQFSSFVKKGRNATLDLKTNDLTIGGIEQVMLSDSQYVYVVPRDGKVIVHRNRDFTFVGRLHAGFFDFYAHQCSFEYDKFVVHLPEIDSLVLAVPSWEVDQGGYHHLVKVKNVLADMSGLLEIDAVNSKSGRKSLPEFPKFTSKDNSFVYFDKKSTVKGVYKRDKFFYSVYPFSMDSLNRLPAENVQFRGKLISGIFPDMEEPLLVQRDYSLGFRKVLPSSGMPVYGGKGTFSDTLRLSNNGLRGSGNLSYLSSNFHSSDLLFCPDSTVGKAKNFNLSKTAGPSENPDAAVAESSIKWVPGSNVMYVRNGEKDAFDMFNKIAKLKGTLALTPGGLKGSGLLGFEDAEVTSRNYVFRSTSFASDTSDFTLFTPDRKSELLKVRVFRVDIDFASRQGHFTASGKGSVMEFPFNKYSTVVDEFDWLMDKKQLQLVNHTSFSKQKYMQMSQEDLIKLNPDDERYISNDPKQDSLRFFAMTALYDLTSNVLNVEDARIVRVADAAIFPKDGKLTIGQDGMIEELKQASIVANTKNLYHSFYNASVKVQTRHMYTAKGLYDYIPSDGDVQTLNLRHISVNGEGNTYALALITDSTDFTLNHYFGFRGNIEIHAEKKPLYFEGGYQMRHDCDKMIRDWVKLRADLDPKKIAIPVEGDIENTGKGKLRVSIFYSATDNTLKPGFFVKPDNITDQDLITASGLLLFDPVKGEYRVTSAEKQKDLTRAGNSLSLSVNRCIMQGEGLMNLLGDLGQLTMTSAGRVNYFSVNDSVSLNIMTALDFFFPDDALKVFADDLIASELKGIDISNINYTKPLREFAGQEEADKLLSELSLYGQYRKFPEVLNHSLVFTDLNLSWNPELRSYINNGPIGISNAGKTSVNRYVKGYAEFNKRRTGDSFTFYFENGPENWYFFSYANFTLQVLSSNKEFNAKIAGLKEEQRVVKGGKGQHNYQFIISTTDKKATFLRKMRQLKGE